jgi:hypothetical protein
VTRDEGDEEGVTPPPRRDRADAKKKFTPIEVSSKFLSLRTELEADAMAVSEATYYAERDTAYSRLNTTRETLTRYVADLERRLGIPRDAKVKF